MNWKVSDGERKVWEKTKSESEKKQVKEEKQERDIKDEPWVKKKEKINEMKVNHLLVKAQKSREWKKMEN